MWLWMILLRGDLQPPSVHISPAQGALAKLGSWRGGKRALLRSYHLPFISPGIVSLGETSLAHKIWNNSSVKWFMENLGSPELTEKWVSSKSCERGSGQRLPLLPCLVAGGMFAAAGAVGKCKTQLGSCRKLFVPPEHSRLEWKSDSTLDFFEVVEWEQLVSHLKDFKALY